MMHYLFLAASELYFHILISAALYVNIACMHIHNSISVYVPLLISFSFSSRDFISSVILVSLSIVKIMENYENCDMYVRTTNLNLHFIIILFP